MKVDIIPSADGRAIVLLEDFWITFNGTLVCVPKGYRSDGASVPRFLWRLLSPCIDPVTLAPSVAHDFLYERRIGTRGEADYWYLGALDMAGYPGWKCILTYFGIRLLGWTRYGN